MDPLNFTSTYNNESYDVMVSIYNDDLSMSAPDRITEADKSILPTESIKYIGITNSMTTFVPTVELEVIDNGLTVNNRLKAQNTRINLNIVKSSGNDTTQLDLTFLVTKYVQIANTEDTATYKIFRRLRQLHSSQHPVYICDFMLA